MNLRVILGILIVAFGLGLAAVNFFSSSIEYGSFAQARTTSKKMQIKGSWIQERGIEQDSGSHSTSFYMVDDQRDTARIILHASVPSNFFSATSIVVKGKFAGDGFHATEVLTKCPSKYENVTVPQSQEIQKP